MRSEEGWPVICEIGELMAPQFALDYLVLRGEAGGTWTESWQWLAQNDGGNHDNMSAWKAVW